MAELIVKKQWYEIIAPKLLGEQAIGETYLASINNAIGRPVLVNLGGLTGDFKQQNYYAKIIVTHVKEGKAYTEFIGYSMALSSVKRMVRRGCTKIEPSFKTVTADGKNLQIKLVILTKNAVQKQLSSVLQRKAREMVIAYIKKQKFIELADDILSHKLQAIARKELSKIYPLRFFEVRFMEIIGAGNKEEVQVEVAAEVPVEEKAQEKEAEEKKTPEKEEKVKGE